MEIKDLQRLLHEKYSFNNWKVIFKEILPNVSLRSYTINVKSNKNNSNINHFNEIGESKLPNGKIVKLFEVKVTENTNLIKNRVALNKEISSHIGYGQADGVIAIFEKGKREYRLTFTSSGTEYDQEKEDFVEKNTDPKRLTYLLGETESCKTPAIRLNEIKKNKNVLDISHIEDAFNVETLSKLFFNDYVKQFDKLVDYLKSKPTYFQAIFEKDETATRDYVKNFMGRLVFLKFIQKKGWLGVPVKEKGWKNGDYQFLENQFKNFKSKATFVSQFLNPLFYEALNIGSRKNDEFQNRGYKIPFLSGGLFNNETPKDNRVDFDEALLTDLFDFFERYNFTIDENDVNDKEVGIDPEMLGRIFENLLEENLREKKDKGAFYTPKEIVRYMCQESLKEYLKTHLQNNTLWPEDEQLAQSLTTDLNNFVEKKETAKVLRYDKELATALRDVKICDPAIGSGAFPMGLLNEIFAMVKQLHEASPDRVGDTWNMQGHSWQPNVVKQSIIQNSIYGVDIEPGAVDIARLRFWLSLIIEEEEPKPLPHLDYKIVVGNSLINKFEDTIIEIDWERKNSVGTANQHVRALQESLRNIIKKQKQYFESQDNAIKIKLRHDIRKLKLDVLINQINFNKELYTNQNQKISNMGFGLKTKDHKKNLEIDFEIAKFSNTLKRLQKLKLDEEKSFNHFDWKLDFPEVMNPEINTSAGFDIVIGNPPYLSNKGVEPDIKEHYGFSDDLYNYFFLKGNFILKNRGIFSYITSSTFLTLQTKSNIRNLILRNQILSLVNLGHDVFESAMVSTAITIFRKDSLNDKNLYEFIDARGKKKLNQAKVYNHKVSMFLKTPNNVFYTPNSLNNQIHELYSDKISDLLSTYWNMISTSRNITKNETVLNKYRECLKPGYITLLGLITDGGQGLATANNGKFVGVVKDSRQAERMYETRLLKLKSFNKQNNTSFDISNKNETEIRNLFDEIKANYGRDCFGQGYLYRIIEDDEIAHLQDLTEEEKKHGINNKRCFVPYDKGDKDGNRWYLKTPYYIDWNIENVKFLREYSGKKGIGMPVIRNSQFYFREGFCWSDIHTVLIKARLKGQSVHDVKSMSLFPLIDNLSAKYLVCIVNSSFASEFSHEFLNNTSSFQINDARRLPIIVPDKNQLREFEEIFDKSYEIKVKKSDDTLSEDEANNQLGIIQKELDVKVYKLYKLI